MTPLSDHRPQETSLAKVRLHWRDLSTWARRESEQDWRIVGEASGVHDAAVTVDGPGTWLIRPRAPSLPRATLAILIRQPTRPLSDDPRSAHPTIGAPSIRRSAHLPPDNRRVLYPTIRALSIRQSERQNVLFQRQNVYDAPHGTAVHPAPKVDAGGAGRGANDAPAMSTGAED